MNGTRRLRGSDVDLCNPRTLSQTTGTRRCRGARLRRFRGYLRLDARRLERSHGGLALLREHHKLRTSLRGGERRLANRGRHALATTQSLSTAGARSLAAGEERQLHRLRRPGRARRHRRRCRGLHQIHLALGGGLVGQPLKVRFALGGKLRLPLCNRRVRLLALDGLLERVTNCTRKLRDRRRRGELECALRRVERAPLRHKSPAGVAPLRLHPGSKLLRRNTGVGEQVKHTLLSGYGRRNGRDDTSADLVRSCQPLTHILLRRFRREQLPLDATSHGLR